MRQADVLHDVGDAGAIVAAAPDGTRSGLDDAVVCRFLGSTASSFHIMVIILHSSTQRKGYLCRQVASPNRPYCGKANVCLGCSAKFENARDRVSRRWIYYRRDQK